MRLIYEDNEYSYFLFEPTFFNLFEINMEKLTLRKRIRYILALLYGYKVFYMKYMDNFIGYCVVTKGGVGRYSFASKNDIIVGPYFIREDYRGKGFSVILLDKVLNELCKEFHYAFDYIKKSNIASIKASERVGFIHYSYAYISKLQRNIILSDKNDNEFAIYRYKNKDYENY